MCHLVTYYEPAQSSGLNVLQTKEFPSADEAKSTAECLVLANCREVRVWNLVGTPNLVHIVEWSFPNE